ncbi:MAG: chromate transporter [Clostridia bacterium]|nr:chromate transporter [Clostridia bacterium]
MIYLRLFLTFLEIGAVSFGGGYGMISLIREKCLGFGWLTEGELMNFIAVAESTPGPIAVNMATFVGSSEGGILGSAVATLGLVLPSFVIILIIASVMRSFIKYRGVQAVIGCVKPVVIGLILATAATMALSVLAGVTTVTGGYSISLPSLIILAIIATVAAIWKRVSKKAISPILLILISAGLGVLFF